MNIIEFQFEYCGVLYSATAEFMQSAQTIIRVFAFSPNLPHLRSEVYFVYNAKKQKMDFPFFGKKHQALAESMFASICESCYDSDIVPVNGLNGNELINYSNQKQTHCLPSVNSK